MSLFKKIFALCLVPYAFWLVIAYEFHFLDWLNLFIHEGGHFLFTFLGEWLHVLGGTLVQLAVPFGIALYFLHRRQKYESAFCGFSGTGNMTGTGCSPGRECWNTAKESRYSFM